MAMTPDEIRAKSFPAVNKGGVDGAAVSSYLSSVAEEVQRLEIALEAAQRDPASAGSPPNSEPTRRSIAVVGSHIDEVLEAAQRSADAIVRDAETWSDEHKTAADNYAAQVRSQIDELRETTEQQAESFRGETVAYANEIREDAEAAAALTRDRAESDAASQYEALTAEATERWEAVKAAERELLSRLNITTSDLTRAQEHFQQAVDNHLDTVIEPTEALVNDADEPADGPEAPRLADPLEPVGVTKLEDVAEVETEAATADIWGDTSDTSDGDKDGFVGLAESNEESHAEPVDAVATAVQVEGEDVDAGDDAILDAPAPPPPPPPPAATGSVEDEVAPTDVWSNDDPATEPTGLDAPADAWGANTQPSTSGWGADDDAPVAADSSWATSDSEETVAAWGTAENTTVAAWGADDAAESDSVPVTDDTVAGWGSDDEIPSPDSDSGAADAPSPWGTNDDQVASTWSDDSTESPEEETTTSWGSSSSSDPWATEPVMAAATDDLAASADSTGPFFSEPTATATDIEDDPLAAMVREAVDRVTDGDGAN